MRPYSFSPEHQATIAVGVVTFFAILLLCNASLAAGADALRTLWPHGYDTPLAQDARGGVPNNPNPPEQKRPQHSLAPLPDSSVGTVRRVQLPPEKKWVALTFDACELQTTVSGFDVDLVNTLRRHGAHATFFAGGKWMRSHTERALQLMATQGFELANHAWSHGNFGIMGTEQAENQILWTQAAYETLYGQLRARAEQAGHPEYMQGIAPALHLFRLPYGRCRPETLKLLNQLGLQVIQWDVIGEQAKDNAAPEVAQQVASQVRSGSIVLLHANTVPHGTATLTAQLIPLLQKQGYTLVTVSELLHAGQAQREQEGYFTHRGDNISLDTRFGKDGTGAR